MKIWLKFLLLAQVLPAALFVFALLGLYTGLTSTTDPNNPQWMIAHKVPESQVWNEFWGAIEVVRFFFIIGLPMAVVILYIERSNDKRRRGFV